MSRKFVHRDFSFFMRLISRFMLHAFIINIARVFRLSLICIFVDARLSSAIFRCRSSRPYIHKETCI